MTNKIVNNIFDFEIYSSSALQSDTAMGLCFSYFKEDEYDPTFLFFLDSLKEEKLFDEIPEDIPKMESLNSEEKEI